MDTTLQLLLFGGLLFVMMRFGCGSHLFGHGGGDKKKDHAGEHAKGHGGGCCGGGSKVAKTPDSAPGLGFQGNPPERDIDPVCGNTVATDTAKTSMRKGLVYFFCSDDCRDAFEGAPGMYVERSGGDGFLSLEQRAANDRGHA